MDQLSRLVAQRRTALIIITHGIALAIHRADRILVMKNGSVVEAATVRELQDQPRSDYARELLANAPRLGWRAAAGATVCEGTEAAQGGGPALLKVANLSKRFTVSHRDIVAVDDVSFEIEQGKTLALVGESGSGKSTRARLVLRLETMSGGSIRFHDAEIGGLRDEEPRQMRQNMQVVYQSPYDSLNPRMRISQIVAEPLRAFGIRTGRERDARAAELLDLVGLPKSFLDRQPAERSGGQQQRVAIARALALSPQLVVCDEPVSALDVLVQAQVLRLLKSLQRELGVAYLFISHDLSVVQDFADSVAVMSRGRIVESGPTHRVFASPRHDYTQQLLNSSGALEPTTEAGLTMERAGFHCRRSEFLATGIALALFGLCGAASAQGRETRAGGDLRAALTRDSRCKDPWQTTLRTQLEHQRQIVDSLVYLGRDGTYAPWLAESWTVNDDATEFTFRLREGVSFSDGAVLDATVVKANFDAMRALAPVAPTPSSYLVDNTGTETVDPHTVVVRFSNPNAPFLCGVSTPNLGIYSARTATLDAASRCAGRAASSGPFTIGSYAPNERIPVVRNDNYR